MADVKIAIAITTDPNHEGGFVNNPADSGGATKYGITQHDLDVCFGPATMNVQVLTLNQAEQYYLTAKEPERFCNPLYGDIVSQAVCNKIFDMGVLFGIHGAVTCAQVVVGIDPADGIFGTHTLAAVNTIDEQTFLEAFKEALVKYVTEILAHKPQQRVFFAGWVARINSNATAPVPYKV